MSALSDNNITLITDRSQEDLDYLKNIARKVAFHEATPEEWEEWKSCALKGAYNYSDFNRVLFASKVLAEALEKAGYKLNLKQVLLSRPNGVFIEKYRLGDIPNDNYKAPLSSAFHNLIQIRKALGIPERNLPYIGYSFEGLNLERANNIERMLEIIDEALDAIGSCLIYCNQTTSICGFSFYAGVTKTAKRVYTADKQAVVTADGKNVYVR